MRIAYLDESGVGDIKKEPDTVVAGVIIQPDTQLRPVERRLAEVRDKFILEEDRKGFIFHAKDLWHGSGATPRERYALDVRWKIMRALADVVIEERIPFVCHAWSRTFSRKPTDPNYTISDYTRFAQGMAFANCLNQVEEYLYSLATNELCVVVCENNENAKKLIRHLHQLTHGQPNEQLLNELKRVAPFKSFFDAVHFVEKKDAPILQLADLGAFIIRRYFRSDSQTDGLAQLGKAFLLQCGPTSFERRASWHISLRDGH